MTDAELRFLEWKHNVLNQLVYPSYTYTLTTTATTKRLPKRHPSAKGYGRTK